MKRTLMKSRIKKGMEEEYKEAHDNIWIELVEEYKKAGLKCISCFLDDNDLYVYCEYDENAVPISSPINEKWQKYMRRFADETSIEKHFTEVFRMG